MRLLRFRGTRGLEPRVNPTRVKRVQHILSQATCDPRDTEGGGERGWKGRAARAPKPNVDRRLHVPRLHDARAGLGGWGSERQRASSRLVACTHPRRLALGPCRGHLAPSLCLCREGKRKGAIPGAGFDEGQLKEGAEAG